MIQLILLIDYSRVKKKKKKKIKKTLKIQKIKKDPLALLLKNY